MKRPQKQEKPNFEHKFPANKKPETRGNDSTNLTLLMVSFKKKVLEKLLISAFSSPLKTLRDIIQNPNNKTVVLLRCVIAEKWRSLVGTWCRETYDVS